MKFKVRNYLPENKFLILLIIVLSLTGPAHYALNYFFPPEGTVFVGYTDDAYMLTLMKSWGNDFNDPWSFDGGKVWHNPLIGSTYLFLILGLIPWLLKINLYVAFVFFKFLFALIYYIVVYNLISVFVKDTNRRNIAFVLFALSAGIGGIIYILARLIFGPTEYLGLIGYAFTREFDELGAVAHSLTHVFRLYYVIPETTAYLSLLFFINNRKLISGFFLGLTFLLYPMHAVSMAIVLLLYVVIKNGFRVKETLQQLWPVYGMAAPFGFAWIIPSLQRPYYYEATKLAYENVPTLNIAVSFFFSLMLAAYYFYKNRPGIFPNKFSIGILAGLLVLFSVENMYKYVLFAETAGNPFFKNFISGLGIKWIFDGAYSYSFIIEILMLAAAVAVVFQLIKSKLGFEAKFFASWAVSFVVLSGLAPQNFGYILNPLRFGPYLLFPLSMLALYGLLELSKNVKINFFRNPLIVLLLIILLSLPSIAGYNLWLQKSARTSDAFYSMDEYNALLFLKNQPDGVVFSSTRYGPYIPYYTGKYGFIFSGRRKPEGLLSNVNRDSDNFYNVSTSVQQREEILGAYNITYVIVGPNEKGIELPSSLVRIRSGGAEVYARY
ncbi:MAG: hypothetical protein HYW26_01935 [Candidatus Aenigmarchaeota archaeon]|nr:hypothetical protein [Candidatus Aenigmarchaeota archaeon]